MIDPNIALGVKQIETPNWMEYAKLRMAQDAQDAQLPGVQAESQMRVYEAQKQADIKRIMTKNASLGPNGELTVDMTKAINEVAGSGYLKDAQSLFANHYANASSLVNSEDAARTFRNNLDQDLNSLASQMDIEQPGSGTQWKATALQNLPKMTGIHKIVKDDPRFQSGARPSSVPQPMPAPSTGGFQRVTGPNTAPEGVQPTGVQPSGAVTYPLSRQAEPAAQLPVSPITAYKASLPPGERIAVDKLMPGSIVSQQARAAAAGVGVPMNPQATAMDVGSNPLLAPKITQQTPGPEAMAEASKDLPAVERGMAITRDAKIAGNAFMQKYNLSPNDRLSTMAGKALVDPNVDKFLRGVELAKAAGIPMPTESIAGGLAAIDAHEKMLADRRQVSRDVLSGKPYSGVRTVSKDEAPTRSREPSVPKPAWVDSTPGSKLMTNKLTKQQLWVPPGKFDFAKEKGFE